MLLIVTGTMSTHTGLSPFSIITFSICFRYFDIFFRCCHYVAIIFFSLLIPATPLITMLYARDDMMLDIFFTRRFAAFRAARFRCFRYALIFLQLRIIRLLMMAMSAASFSSLRHTLHIILLYFITPLPLLLRCRCMIFLIIEILLLRYYFSFTPYYLLFLSYYYFQVISYFQSEDIILRGHAFFFLFFISLHVVSYATLTR